MNYYNVNLYFKIVLMDQQILYQQIIYILCIECKICSITPVKIHVIRQFPGRS